MSLLLQALQKAARSRETSADDGAAGPPGPVQEPSFDFDPHGPPVDDEPGSAELALADDADLFEPEVVPEPEPVLPAPTRPGSGSSRSTALNFGASAADAATILRASEERSAGWLDWVRDRPVHAFAIVAGIFLGFYGVYVYLQIFHPAVLRGDFLIKPPLKAKAPPPPLTPISCAASRPGASACGATAVDPSGCHRATAPRRGRVEAEPETHCRSAASATGGCSHATGQARRCSHRAQQTARSAAGAERTRPSARARRARGAAPKGARRGAHDPLEDTVAVRQTRRAGRHCGLL